MAFFHICKQNPLLVALADGVTDIFTSSELKIGERCEKLNQQERKIFAVLCRNKKKLCKRDLLLEAGWNNKAVHFEAQLNKQIGKLKQKLKGAEGMELVVDCGNGYCLKTK